MAGYRIDPLGLAMLGIAIWEFSTTEYCVAADYFTATRIGG
jgi:hypothetical protein